MTEQKPYAWTYGRWGCDDAYVSLISPMDRNDVRDVRPLYLRPAPPTEQKPVAWLYEQEDRHGDWYPRSCTWRPGEAANLRNVRPLYEHPAPAQPATDPAVEAARRKALRAILAALAEFSWDDDCAGVVRVGVLRDLVGRPRKDPERRIPGYDAEPDLKVSAMTHETRVNTAELMRKETAPPALLSVGMLASIIRNRAGLCLCVIDTRTCAAIATAVHEAVYGKDGK